MCFTFWRMNRQPAVSLFGNLIGKMRNTLKQRNTKESKIQIIILILIQGPCLHTNLNVCSKKLQETVRTNHKPLLLLGIIQLCIFAFDSDWWFGNHWLWIYLEQRWRIGKGIIIIEATCFWGDMPGRAFLQLLWVINATLTSKVSEHFFISNRDAKTSRFGPLIFFWACTNVSNV